MLDGSSNNKRKKKARDMKKVLRGIVKHMLELIGSWYSVSVHAVWMCVWFILHMDLLLLTLILSIEAIFLCLFILMAQIIEQKETDEQKHIDSRNIADIKRMLDHLMNQQDEQTEILEEVHEEIHEDS